VDPVPDPLLLKISGSAENRTRTSGYLARNSWPVEHRGGPSSLIACSNLQLSARLKKLAPRIESFLWICQSLIYSRLSQDFTKPEGSLPYTQDLSISLYPERDESSYLGYLTSLRLFLILSSHLVYPWSGLCISCFFMLCYIICPSHSHYLMYVIIFGEEYNLWNS
jgi:hypothetical protein